MPAVRNEEVRVTADVNNFVTKMAAASAAANGFAKRLDEADQRMSGLVQTGLALAPALVPLGAAVVPAIAGLANQLGVAAIAAGTAVLAFQGVGDAVKSIDAYKLAPTAANFAKMKEALDKLGPAGQEFALFIDDVKPKLQGLQDVAQQGLFPGMEQGIRDLMPLLPRVKAVVFGVSSAMGELAQQGAEALTTDRWQQFFSFLQADASTTALDLGRTVGNIAEGFVSLLQAFDPLSQSFSTGLLNMSRDFADWAAGLSKTQGFRDFLSYVEHSGPRALDAIGAIAKALISIVEAAAPVGTAVLPVITALANGLSALADSSIGPILITTAAAVGVLGRSLALLQTVGLRGRGEAGGAAGFLTTRYVKPAKGVVGAFRDMRVASDELRVAEEKRVAAAASTRNAQFALIPAAEKRGAIDRYKAALGETAAAETRLRDASKARGDAMRTTAATIGKAGVAAAGLAVATSGVADNMGLSNTATLAMMGMLAGPWGAAIGGGIGLAMDFASANKDVADAIQQSSDALKSSSLDFGQQDSLFATARTNQQHHQTSIDEGNAKVNPFNVHTWDNLSSPGDAVNAIRDKFFGDGAKNKKAVDDQLRDINRLKTGAAAAFEDLSKTGDKSLFKGSSQQLTDFANKVTPALNQAGIKVKDFFRAARGSDLNLKGLGAIRSYFESFNSASGKSKAVGEALAGLSSQMTDTATAAGALKSAMDNLFGVQLSQSAAADAYTTALQGMQAQIKKTNGQIFGNSKAALSNRAAIRGSVQSLQDKVSADAAAGVSGAKLVDELTKGREAIIRQGVAAGASRGAMHAYIHELGLTPKHIATIITADGALTAMQKAEALGKLYGIVPKDVHTLIRQSGGDRSAKAIAALAHAYHLTPKEVRTILNAFDKTKKGKDSAQKNVDSFHGKNADLGAKDKTKPGKDKAQGTVDKFHGKEAPLTARNLAGTGVNAAQATVNSFHGKSVDVTVNYRRNGTKPNLFQQTVNPGAGGIATGGHIRGPGTATSDSIPAWLSDGEYVVRAAAVDRYGVGLFDRINSLQLASGGSVGSARASSGDVAGLTHELRASRREAKAARDEARARARARTRRQDALEAKRKKASDKLNNLLQSRRDYANTVRGAFVADPFGGTLGGFEGQLRHETAKLSTARTDLSKLRRRGLSGALLKDLTASGNANLIHQFAGLSRAQLAKEESAYRRRNSIDYAIGTAAGKVAYPGESALRHEITKLTGEIHALRHGRHIGNTNFNGRVTIRDSDAKTKTKTAARRVRHA